jgi:virulence-associated protein VagC
MSTSVAAQMTSQGLLIPRDAILEWMEQGIEVIKEKSRIVIQPRPEPATERERVLQILEVSGLLLSPEPLPASHKPLSQEEKAELARKFSIGKPLSEIVIEEREDRA